MALSASSLKWDKLSLYNNILTGDYQFGIKACNMSTNERLHDKQVQYYSAVCYNMTRYDYVSVI